MEAINRRSTLALGLTVVASPLVAGATPAAAQTYGPDEGKRSDPVSELLRSASGLRSYQLTKWSSCGM